MEVLIVTRLCIGYQREDLFEYRLGLLEATAARSIAAQTDQNFRWVIATDQRAPEWVFPRLEALGSNVVVFKRDPTLSGITPLGGKAVAALTHDRVCLVRLDDDDLLRRDFVARTREIATSLPLNSAITWRNGYNLYEGGVEEAEYAWSGQGTTTVTTAKKFFNPYTTNHLRLGAKAEKLGGVAYVGDERMWVRTWHTASDSTAARGIRFEQAGGKADLSDYGVDDHQAVFRINGTPPPAPPLFNGRAQAASEVKALLYNLIAESTRDMAKTDDIKEIRAFKRRIARLAHALYNA